MPTDVDAASGVRTDYEQTRNRCQQSLSDLRSANQRIATGRFLVLAAWVALFFLGITGTLNSTVAWTLAAIVLACFVVLISRQDAVSRSIRLDESRAEICRVQLARLDRDWKQVPACEIDIPSDAEDVSRDLDLFGHASLYQLMCRAHTVRGKEILRDWLVKPAAPEEILQRNRAAETLASMTEYREDLEVRGRLLGDSSAGPGPFVAWAEGDGWLRHRPWLVWASRLLAVAFLVCGLNAYLNIIYPNYMVYACLGIVVVNLLLSVLFCGRAHDTFDRIDSRQNDVLQYQQLLELFDQLPDQPEFLARLRTNMGGSTEESRSALAKLSKLMGVARMRHSGVMGIMHLLSQLAVLIDFHVLSAVEQWQAKHGANVRNWFESIGELEAIASVASLVHDNPQWKFPRVTTDTPSFSATQLGHPLLARPVRNDVQIGPRGNFLLVTGSNMSGKSTLLRSVGLNAVLAQAGASVLAEQLALPPVSLATSMRIQDSLEDGISFFMAELKRLKDVVDHAESLAGDERTQLFLLDEILQGTNSAERHIAVAKVVRRLTESGALGAISTHDLELAGNSELSANCETVHFKESFTDDGQMTFDYQMRDGVATTTNALKLLELVGIRDRTE